MSFLRYNPREMGAYVASQIMNSLMNTFNSTSLNEGDLPKFANSRSFTYDFPGDIRVFQTALPELQSDLISLVTGDIDSPDICVVEVRCI